jgi:hypothetical protein
MSLGFHCSDFVTRIHRRHLLCMISSLGFHRRHSDFIAVALVAVALIAIVLEFSSPSQISSPSPLYLLSMVCPVLIAVVCDFADSISNYHLYLNLSLSSYSFTFV